MHIAMTVIASTLVAELVVTYVILPLVTAAMHRR